MDYIAYFRISTQSQGRSGLGLEAQRQQVHRFLREGDQIIKEFVEVESGKRNNRPQLQEAIRQVSQSGAHLLIAKLDRLSRNAGFIFTLRDSKVPFVAADMPDANNLTVGIMAVLADHERQLISERTSAALQVKKNELASQGKKLGTPENLKENVRLQGIEIRRKNAYDNPNNRRAGGFAVSLHKHGNSYSEIARQLNAHGFITRRGKEFTHRQAKKLIIILISNYYLSFYFDCFKP